jgi:hypothetical protein
MKPVLKLSGNKLLIDSKRERTYKPEYVVINDRKILEFVKDFISFYNESYLKKVDEKRDRTYEYIHYELIANGITDLAIRLELRPNDLSEYAYIIVKYVIADSNAVETAETRTEDVMLYQGYIFDIFVFRHLR